MPQTLTLDCSSFSVSTLADGRLRLELADPVDSSRDSNFLNRRYNIHAAAARLSDITGQSVSPSTLRKWLNLKKNPIPFHKPGGRLVFIESDLQAWAARGGVHPAPASAI